MSTQRVIFAVSVKQDGFLGLTPQLIGDQQRQAFADVALELGLPRGPMVTVSPDGRTIEALYVINTVPNPDDTTGGEGVVDDLEALVFERTILTEPDVTVGLLPLGN